MESDQSLARVASWILGMRARRKTLFGAHMFDEFGWNMLLALFIAHAENVVLEHAALYTASDTIPLIGRRWLIYLESQRFVVRSSTGQVKLTDNCLDRLRSFLVQFVMLL